MMRLALALGAPFVEARLLLYFKFLASQRTLTSSTVEFFVDTLRNAPDVNRRTPDVAIHILLACVCFRDLPSCVPSLLSMGVDLDRRFTSESIGMLAFSLEGSDQYDLRPLQYAARSGSLETAAALLRCGVPDVAPGEKISAVKKNKYNLYRYNPRTIAPEIIALESTYHGYWTCDGNLAAPFLRSVRQAGGYRLYIGAQRSRLISLRRLYYEGRASPPTVAAEVSFLRNHGVSDEILCRIAAACRLAEAVRRLCSLPEDIFREAVRYWAS